jgi:hypothetical protein
VPRRRPIADVRAVLELKAQGWTDREVSATTGVPINTIRTWRNHRLPKRAARALGSRPACPRCEADPHDFSALPADTYAYLLGVYLGDGCVSPAKSSWSLRIALDEAYPGIVESCCGAIETIRGGHRPNPRPDSRGTRCVRVESTWKQWGCLFPQHGPGRKHARKIGLVDWQHAIVDRASGAFLRGLIHTDGWRGINRVHVKGKDYEYPATNSRTVRMTFGGCSPTLARRSASAGANGRDTTSQWRGASRSRFLTRSSVRRSDERPMRAEGLEPPRAKPTGT